MTKAKITKQDGFKWAPEGHTVVTIPFGVQVEGRAAEKALEAGAAIPAFDPVEERKVTAPKETKRRGKKK